MEDVFGRQIEQGDVLAYCTRFGSTMDMHVATVDEVVPPPPKKNSWDRHYGFLRCTRTDGSRVTLRAPTAVIINGVSLEAMKAAKAALDREEAP